MPSHKGSDLETMSPIPEKINFSGALFKISVSATIPYAIFAGTEVRLPFTNREALALENRHWKQR